MGMFMYVWKLAHKVFLQASPLDSDPSASDTIFLDPTVIISCLDCLELLNTSIMNTQIIPSLNLLLLYILTVYIKKTSHVQSKTQKGPRIVALATLDRILSLLPTLELPTHKTKEQSIGQIKATLVGSIFLIGVKATEVNVRLLLMTVINKSA